MRDYISFMVYSPDYFHLFLFLFVNFSVMPMDIDAEGICIWKRSYLSGGTSFNGGKLCPEADLNRCIICQDYMSDTKCIYYVPFTHDRKKFSDAVRLKLRRIAER